MDNKINKILSRYETLKSNRTTWEQHWQEVAEYVIPRKSTITKIGVNGEKRHQQIFNNTAEYLNQMLASTFNGMLTNPSTEFFQLKIQGIKVQQNTETAKWLDDAQRIVYETILNSNFAQEVDENYLDLGCFGTSVMYVEEDEEKNVRFRSFNINECVVNENVRGEVDTLYRTHKMPLAHIVEQFGIDSLPEDIKKRAEKNPEEKEEVIHAVFPRTDRDKTKKDAKNRKYASYWILKSGNKLLHESGFHEFPFAVCRFRKNTGEIYGRSPAMTALPTIKTIQTVMKTGLQASQLRALPPYVARRLPREGFSLTPGAVNIVNNVDDIQPLVTGADPRVADAEVQDLMQQIKEMFYYDIILTQDGPQRTATEIMQRTDERSRLLVSTLNRITTELLEPLINRVVSILFRNNKFPETPEELGGKELKVKFTSPLARAQTAHEANGIMRTIETLLPLVQLGVPVMDRFRMDEAVKIVAESYNVPARALLTDDEINKVREQQQQAAQQEQEMQQLERAAEGTRKLSEAERNTKDTNGAASQLLNG